MDISIFNTISALDFSFVNMMVLFAAFIAMLGFMSMFGMFVNEIKEEIASNDSMQAWGEFVNEKEEKLDNLVWLEQRIKSDFKPAPVCIQIKPMNKVVASSYVCMSDDDIDWENMHLMMVG